MKSFICERVQRARGNIYRLRNELIGGRATSEASRASRVSLIFSFFLALSDRNSIESAARSIPRSFRPETDTGNIGS